MPKKTSRKYSKRSNTKLTPRERRHKKNEVEEIFKELLIVAKSEWGKLWVKSILKFGRPYRMQRGVRYAQEERVENLTISSGQIFATVQGTAPTPYRIKIIFETIPEEGWKKIIESIAKKAKYLIQLLQNHMPEALMDIFKKAGYPLYPPMAKNLTATCSCPDKAIPCKHIAATVLYLAKVIDFNPFLILELRGKTKDQILHELSLARSCANRPIAIATKSIREKINVAETTFDVPGLISDNIPLDRFFTGDPYDIGFRISKPGEQIKTLDTLGIAPNLEDPDKFHFILNELYHIVSKKMYKTAVKQEQKEAKK